jgi:hypothetical protein
MNKIAQRRSILNKLREKINAPLGGAAEQFFNPQFSGVMESMREIDSNARSIVSGKSIEDGDPGPDPIAFKDLLKSAKSNLNRREFMAAVADLSRFHKKLSLLLSEFAKFDSKLDEIHHQFLVKDVGDEHLDEIRGLKNRWSSDRQRETQIIKEAGAIADFLKSWSDPRGRALRFYDKRYGNEKLIKNLRGGLTNGIRDGERLLSKILASLGEMATARATRNPDKYSDGIRKIKTAFTVYDTSFKTFYNEAVKPVADKLVPEKIPTTEEAGAEEIAPDTEPKVPSYPPLPSGGVSSGPLSGMLFPSSNRGTGDTPTPSSIPQDRPNEFGNDIEEYMNKLHNPVAVPPSAPPGVAGATGPQLKVNPTMIGVAPAANPPKNETIGYGPGMTAPPASAPHIPVLAHKNFYASLESMSGEHPQILANYISKYAKSIQGTDPTTAIKLLQIAKSVRG